MNTSSTVGNKLLPIIMFTLMISSMNSLMFNFVLSDIKKEFQLSLAQVSWLTTSYTLIYAIGTVTYGKLSERFRLKTMLTYGLSTFAIGSLLGLASQTFWMALMSRFLQAIGAATIPATSMLIPIRYFDPENRGKAMGMISMGLSLGIALGPIISALVVSIAHWRWLFFIPILILATLPFFRKYLQNESIPENPPSFDWLGGLLLSLTITFLLLGITNSWWVYLFLGLLFFILFVSWIYKTPEPFIQPKLFKNKQYSTGLILAILFYGSTASFFFLVPLILANIHHLSSNWVSLSMVPAALSAALVSRKAGSLADKKGDAYLFFLSIGFLLTGFLLFSTFVNSSPIWIIIFLIIGILGQSFGLIALTNTITKTLSKSEAGVGMGMLMMLNFIVQSMAIGIYGKLVDIGSSIHLNPMPIQPSGWIYSNIFLVLSILQILIILIYYIRFFQTSAKISSE